MKKIIASLLTLALLTPALAFAHPGDWGPGGWGRHGGPGHHWGGPGAVVGLTEAGTGGEIGGLN